LYFLFHQDGHLSETSHQSDPLYIEAKDYVKKLLLSKIVYRTLTTPVGQVEISENKSYSIRGYFLPATGTGYQFITSIPMRQYWKFNVEVNNIFLKIQQI
jgi:hypothetical protein